MVVPTKRNSKSKVKRRRLNKKLKPVNLVDCKHCKKKTLSHRPCLWCGNYK